MEQSTKEVYLNAREYWSAGRANEAQASYREAIRLDPNLPHPHFDLAKLLEILGKDEAEIINHYERFIVLASGNPKLAPQVEQARQRIRLLQSAVKHTPAPSQQENLHASKPVQKSPQVVYMPVPTSQTPQVQYIPYPEPKKKRGCLLNLAISFIVIFICAIVIIFALALLGPSIGEIFGM